MAEPDLRAVAFPTLDEAQMAELERCAGPSLKEYRDGQRRFQVGDRDFKFFVVKSGAVEIRDESGDAPKTVTVHRPGEFTGDVSHLTGDPVVVSAVARGDTEVYEMPVDGLRQILNQCPDLSDLLMQAFIAREAKPGKEEDVACFLRGSLAVVEDEPATTAWFAIRLGPSTFGIFDAFPDEAGRQAHLSGRVAAALTAKAPDLFAQVPTIKKLDVLAAKLPQ